MLQELHKPLSERELEILYLAAEGKPDKEIGDLLGISGGSIRTYWDRVRQKTGTSSRTEAVARVLAVEHRAAVEALRRSELTFTKIIEALQDVAVFGMDKDGIISNWNKGVLAVLGFEEDEFIGKPFSIIFTVSDVELGLPERELALAAQHGRHQDVQMHARKSGDLLFAAGFTYAIRDDAGELEGFAKVMRDVTHEKQLKDDYDELRLKLADRS